MMFSLDPNAPIGIFDSGLGGLAALREAHPYTQILLFAVPIPDPTYGRKRVAVPGEIPSPTDKPPGCRFHPRCPYTEDICRHRRPGVVPLVDGHVARCHFALDIQGGNKTKKDGSAG